MDFKVKTELDSPPGFNVRSQVREMSLHDKIHSEVQQCSLVFLLGPNI